MNYTKVQSDIISEINKRKVNGGRPVMFDEMEGTPYVGVVTSPYYAYVLPKHEFLLDKSKIDETEIISRNYSRDNYAKPLRRTGVTRQFEKRTVIELLTENDTPVLLDEKFVKKFGKPSDLTFQSENEKTGVFVHDLKNGFLVGIIMPFNPNVKKK